MSADKPFSERMHEQLGQMVKSASDYLSGSRGRKSQLLFLFVAIGFIWAFGFGRAILLLLIVAGMIAILMMQETPIPAGAPTPPPTPVPPPLPRDAVQTPGPPPSRRRGFWGKLFTFAIIVATLYLSVRVFRANDSWRVVDELVEHSPQAREFFGNHQVRARIDVTRGPEVVKSPLIPARDKADGKVEAALAEAERAIDAALPEKGTASAPPLPAVESSHAEAPQTPIPTTEPDAMTPAGMIQVKSDPYPTEAAVREAVLRDVAEELSQSLVRSGRPVAVSTWIPDLDWTERNFVTPKDVRIEEIASQTPGVPIYVAEASVPNPDENKLEQIWHEFKGDRGATRSLTLMKAYAGAVFTIGGLGVFLRLGTGRRPAPGELSWKDRMRGWRRRPRA